MQNYVVRLQSPISKSFRCQKAADSLDIDTEKKSIHELRIKADLETPFQIGMIIGSSGSGKTTLAKKMFGEDCFTVHYDASKPVIEQFPAEMTYDECAEALLGIGLTSVPCWIRPMYTLSNGQRARAEAALALYSDRDTIIIDEWTSVVDRTVAKVMSHCVQKFARRRSKKVILLSCHFDIIEWVNPDWVINCNEQTYEDRRSLRPARTEKLEFTIKEIDSSSWGFFSKYHYLSDRLPGGKLYFYGLFQGENQIGFQCYAAYLPGRNDIMYSNRVVIHPDYAGLGLGLRFIDETAKYMASRGFFIRATFSSVPLYKARMKSKFWRLLKDQRKLLKEPTYENDRGFSRVKKDEKGKDTFRHKVRVFSFEYRPMGDALAFSSLSSDTPSSINTR